MSGSTISAGWAIRLRDLGRLGLTAAGGAGSRRAGASRSAGFTGMLSHSAEGCGRASPLSAAAPQEHAAHAPVHTILRGTYSIP